MGTRSGKCVRGIFCGCSGSSSYAISVAIMTVVIGLYSFLEKPKIISKIYFGKTFLSPYEPFFL